MPNNTYEGIFTLIRSLTMAEKRHFKSYASMGSAKENMIYVQLFNVIEAQTKYNEQKILKKIPGIKPAYLSVKKNHLTELILDSLQLYHSGKNIDARLWSLICKIDVLYTKRLYKLCSKQIKKAKELAQLYDRYQQLSVILTWEAKNLGATTKNEQGETKMEQVLTDNISVSKKINEDAEYQAITNKLFRFHVKGEVLSNAMAAKLHEIIEHPLLKKANPTSFFEINFYNRIFFFYHYMQEEWEKSYLFQKKVIENFESNPQHIYDSPHSYLSAINNFLITCGLAKGKEKELENRLVKASQLVEKLEYSDNLMVLLMDCRLTVLTYYNSIGEFQKGSVFLEQIENSFNKFKSTINKPREVAFYYNLAYNYFGLENYSLSLFWLRKITNNKDTGMRNDLQIIADLFNIVIHYEMGNESLEYYTKATYRSLLSKKEPNKIEVIALEFIRKLPALNSKKDLYKSFQELKLVLEKRAMESNGKNIFSYFDFISWLESKIVQGTPGGENRTFADIVREKGKTG